MARSSVIKDLPIAHMPNMPSICAKLTSIPCLRLKQGFLQDSAEGVCVLHAEVAAEMLSCADRVAVACAYNQLPISEHAISGLYINQHL